MVPNGQAATGVTHPDISLEALLAVLLVGPFFTVLLVIAELMALYV